jgi:hypothetical protein
MQNFATIREIKYNNREIKITFDVISYFAK